MAIYKNKRVDHGNNVWATDKIECADDGAAIAEAFRLHSPVFGYGFDIWDGERLVHRHRERGRRPLV